MQKIFFSECFSSYLPSQQQDCFQQFCNLENQTLLDLLVLVKPGFDPVFTVQTGPDPLVLDRWTRTTGFDLLVLNQQFHNPLVLTR